MPNPTMARAVATVRPWVEKAEGEVFEGTTTVHLSWRGGWRARSVREASGKSWFRLACGGIKTSW
jgi:hypothetical protein